MQIEQDVANELASILRECGYEPRSYSGRGMYGQTCMGITIDARASQIKLGFDLAEGLRAAGMEDSMDILEDVKQDSMGLDSILYWERVPAPADSEDDEDEKE